MTLSTQLQVEYNSDGERVLAVGLLIDLLVTLHNVAVRLIINIRVPAIQVVLASTLPLDF